MNQTKRTRAVYRALERTTSALGRPPSRVELCAAIDEPWADTSAVSLVLGRLAKAGYVKRVGAGHDVLVRTDDGLRVIYFVEFATG